MISQQKLIVELVRIQKDGTVEVDLTKDTSSELLEYHSIEGLPADIDFIATDSNKSIPRLKVAMLVVGTRGDVQPFLAVAKRLQACFVLSSTLLSLLKASITMALATIFSLFWYFDHGSFIILYCLNEHWLAYCFSYCTL